MSLYDILDQVVALLQRRGRVSYRALKREFNLDDDFIEDLKEELFFSGYPVSDENGRGLVWTSDTEVTPELATQPDQTMQQPATQEESPTQVESPPLQSRASDAAERRQLTVMFCDLVDSTVLAGQLDPEDLRAVVRAYQATCTDVIQRYEGHVAQLLGDGLLVYFGYPSAHEDDAQRAVCTGLGIVEALGALNTRLEPDKGIKLAVRLGVHTGLTVIGEMGGEGRHEQLALGETPNVAARIQGLAAPDTLIISDATYRLVQGFFDCDSLGEHDLRGVSQPIAVYRVLKESDAQNRLDVVSPRGLTPLVGRESEMSLLLDRWEQATSAQGQVVLLSGEAGIGKSKLVRTLRERVASEPHNRLECRCSPYFQHTTLYPLLDLLERTLGFERQDTPATKLQKLEAALRQYRLDRETTVPLLAFPLSIPLSEDRYPPLNMTPQRRKQRVLETFIAMMLEAAEREPVLFILEDLHWVDATTIELLDLLIEQVPTAPILAVLTCRPAFQPPWGLKSHLTPIALNRLPRNQVETLIERVTNGKRLPDEVMQHLIEKTDGVPLYVEEMTKALLESGHLKEHDTGYALTEPLATVSIPMTLQDSLMARLDNLGTAKGVAQLGATIGRQFSYDLLQAVSPLGEASLQSELEQLIDAELIYQRGVTPNPLYIFKHALVQDTAYETLLRSTRQGYHRRIAEVLEERFPETVATQPELLAHHSTEAGRNQEAVAYWKQAGERAIQRSANIEAIAHLTQGLEVCKTLPDTPESRAQELALHLALGSAFMAAKGYATPEVEQVYIRAWELCQHVQDSPQLFSVLVGLRLFYSNRGELHKARDVGDQLLTLAARLDEKALLLEAHYAQGVNVFRLGDLVRAREHLEHATALYVLQTHNALPPRAGHDHEVGYFTFASRVLLFLGYPEQAYEQSTAALRRAHELSQPLSMAFASMFAIRLHIFRHEIEAAHAQIEQMLHLATTYGFGSQMPHATFFSGWLLTVQGQPETGIARMHNGLDDLRATGVALDLSYVLALIAEAYGKSGQTALGLCVLTKALDQVEQIDERFYEAELHRLQGDLLLQQSPNNSAEAETCFHKAISIAQNQSAKSWELRAATSLARLYQQQGKRDKARALLGDVYGWFTEGFDTADLKDAKALLDELTEGSS